MRRHVVSLAVIVAIGVAWYVAREHMISGPPHPTAGSAATSVLPATATAAAGFVPTAPRVRQISRADRERLAAQIAAAQAARAARVSGAAAHTNGGAGEAPALPADDHTHDLDRVSEPVLDALGQAIPFLAACYEQQGSAQPGAGDTAVAQMTLTNDPDIGAVIDADQIVDDKQAPLDPKVDACLRATMQTLQLPPLDAGDTVKMQYSFRFK